MDKTFPTLKITKYLEKFIILPSYCNKRSQWYNDNCQDNNETGEVAYETTNLTE